MNAKDFQKKAIEIKGLYAKLNTKEGREKWTYKEFTEALVGDVGDLMKLVMAKGNYRGFKGEDLDEELKHELCDCLWAVLVIANELGYDMSEEFPKKMDELKERVSELLN